MKRRFLIACSIALAGLLGASLGAYVGWHQALKTVPVTDLFTSAEFSVFLAAQRNSGDVASYEDALRAHVSFTDTLLARDRDPTDQRLYTFQKAVSLMRLSQLAERRNATEEAARLAHDAENLCPVLRARDCSAESLRAHVQKLDGRNPSAGSADK
jgi:hypothetical protein